MRKVSIRVARPGQKLARDITTDKGHVLLRAGRELNAPLIDRLRTQGVDTLFIEDRLTEGIRPIETLEPEARSEAIRRIRHSMANISKDSTIPARAVIPSLGETFREIFRALLSSLSVREAMLINLTDLYVKDDYLFNQSINVAVLSIIMGISKGYNEQQLEELGVGALLADIGMVRLSAGLWNKAGTLTEEEWQHIRRHPEEGYQFLRSQPDIALASALCAAQHHERYDGEGYPYGLKGDEIHEYAQIIAIADVYSALTSTRKHRQRYTPGEAIEYLYAVGNRQFSLELLRLFCAQIAIYPVASTVKLNTGQTAVVAEVKPSLITRPTVRVISEPDGSAALPRDIDLSVQHNITIVNII